MKIMTLDIMKKLPARYANESIGLDAPVVFKLFYPDFDWTWFISEGTPYVKNASGEQEEFENYQAVLDAGYTADDIEEWVFFGLVDGFDAELGYFHLSELLATKGKMGCSIERDKYFADATLKEVMEKAIA